MRSKSFVRRLLSAAAMVSAVALGGATASADPIEIDIPYVALQTTSPSMFMFNHPSDLTGWDTVNFVGVPGAGPGEEANVLITMTSSANVPVPAIITHTVQNAANNMVDTIIQFNSTGTLNNIGDIAVIDVQLAALNLAGTEPLELNLGGMFGYYDVSIEIDHSGPQTPGTMTFTRTGENTMSFELSLPESLVVTLEGDSNIYRYEYDFLFEGTGGLVVLPDFEGGVPAPAGLALLGPGLLALGALRRRRRAA